MDKIYMDFETKSSVDITAGVAKYLRTPESDIICMSYAINDWPVKLWIPGMKPFPYNWTKNECVVYAFNIQFDEQVNNILGIKHLFPHLPLSKCIDVQALCGRYTYPQNLKEAGRVLNLANQKMESGTRLMKKITQPPFKYTEAELKEFYRYCMGDVESLRDMVRALPAERLAPDEQQVWLDTVEVNRNGLPIDLESSKRIYGVAQYYLDRETKKIPDITDGRVQTINQTAKIRSWASGRGVELPNLQKDTVASFLEEGVEDDSVRQILEMRRLMAKSSVAKYKRLIAQTYKGRVYENLRYHRASTGRWGGLGFQMHNLPRASVEDPEATIQRFKDTSILEDDVMFAASALIRNVICAPEGKRLAVADYSAIENRIIAWVCKQHRIVKLFYEGLDEYKDFAVQLFEVKYDDVSKDQRTFGKVVILGAGYGLGAVGFQEYASGYGLDIDREQAEFAIRMYRKTHPKIVKGWYDLKDAAVNAIMSPGHPFDACGCIFKVVRDRNKKVWLTLRLPSNRILFYESPLIKEDKYGYLPTHMGINNYNRKWQRMKLIPGRIMENVVQALARDVLAHGIRKLLELGFKVIGHVHDEVICEIWEDDKNHEALEYICEAMCVNPIWAEGLPLDAEGEVLKRYKKI